MAERVLDRQGKVMSNNAFNELRAILADAKTEGDLIGHVLSWLQDVWGRTAAESVPPMLISSQTKRAPRETREVIVARVIRRDGKITSGSLAEASRCTTETARLTLVALADGGKLRQCGEFKGTHYIPTREGSEWIRALDLG